MKLVKYRRGVLKWRAVAKAEERRLAYLAEIVMMRGFI